jgi:hypothetical protein
VLDVHSALHLIKGLSAEAFVLVEPTVTAFAAHLGVEAVLVALRGIAAAWLGDLPKPLGFAPRRRGRRTRGGAFQHRAGPDPPGSGA